MKQKPTTIILDEKHYKILEKLAYVRSVSKSKVVRDLIDDYIKKKV